MEDQTIQQLKDLASDNGSTLIQVPYGWEPRLYQDPCWQYFQDGGTRACDCWHRRAGKDLFGINLICKKNQERPGLYWHCFPTQAQGRKTIWDGATNDGRPFLDHFPGFRNPGAPASLVQSKREDLMQVKFKPTRDPVTLEMRDTGGVYQVIGLDDPDTTVGPNPFGIVYSEWSLCPERAWHLHKPMLNANGGWALFIFTMRGRNHAWQMLQKAKKSKKWFWEVLTIEDTYTLVKTQEKDENGEAIYVPRPVVTQEMVQEDRDEGMPEETIQSEYYGSADSPMPGSYYGAIINQLEKNRRGPDGKEIEGTKQITKVPHDPKLFTHTMWDIGHDSTAIIFFQAIGQEIRLINFYQNDGEGFPFYARICRELGTKEGYVWGSHYGPHDLAQREYMSGGKSKLQIAKDLGYKFILVAKHSLEDGIEETRAMLKRCWIDEDLCKDLIEALRAYHKEFDEKHQVFKEQPVHDWASHPADCLRQGAMGYKDKMTFRRKKEGEMNKAKTNYNELSY